LRAVAAAVALVALACAAPVLEIPPLPQPFEPGPTTPALAFKSMESRMRGGVIIGSHYTALGTSPYLWPEAFGIDQDEVGRLAREELRSLGFDAPDPGGPFDDFDLAKSRFWLAARLLHVHCDGFNVVGRWNQAEATGRFFWQVYDARDKTVVLEQTSTGYVRLPISAPFLGPLLQDSLRRLVAQPGFAKLMLAAEAETQGAAAPKPSAP